MWVCASHQQRNQVIITMSQHQFPSAFFAFSSSALRRGEDKHHNRHEGWEAKPGVSAPQQARKQAGQIRLSAHKHTHAGWPNQRVGILKFKQ